MKLKTELIALMFIVTGCANNIKPFVVDGDFKSNDAFLAIKIIDKMQYPGYDQTAKGYSFELNKIDRKTLSIISKVKIEAPRKLDVHIFSIEPGCYFVGDVSKWVDGTGSYYFSSSPKESMFCTNAGSITYPGDWKLTLYKSEIHAHGTAANGGFSFIWNYGLTPIINSSTLIELREKYPLLVKNHSIEFSNPVYNN